MLSIDGIDAYYGKSQILEKVSISIRQNEMVGLLGRNGAGKTTMLRSIVGLVQIGQGSITLENDRIDSARTHSIARKGVVLVPDYRGALAGLTVEENLLIAARARSNFGIAEAYAFFPRLEQRRKNSGNELSGGEQQMLAIARGLLCGPKVLLLDEPTQGLAPIIVDEITDTLKRLRDRGDGPAVLLVDQNLDVCLSVAHRHYVIEQGKIAMEITSEKLRNSTDIQQRYLGVDH